MLGVTHLNHAKIKISMQNDAEVQDMNVFPTRSHLHLFKENRIYNIYF